MQLIIKNGKVVAEYEDHQDPRGDFPGCEVISWGKRLPVIDPLAGLPDDPRSLEEKRMAYKDLRRMEYPTVLEQLDMMYHDQLDGRTTWTDAITAVKEKYPEPK